jgi:hypothetical protein
MIISQLNSGLGNQMFQYAAAKSLSTIKKTSLCLDISWYLSKESMQTIRSYELSVFNLKEDLVYHNTAYAFYNEGNSFFNKIINKIERNIPYYKKKQFEEQMFEFDPNFFKARKDAIISGYWQSEKYFDNISEIIRNTFTCLDNDWGKEDREILNTINASQTVSVHVRRGDMVNNSEVAKVHGACDLEYYNKSIEYLNNKIDSLVFIIFSDDTKWAKENIKISNKTIFVDHNKDEKAWLDMQLMSKCNHNIIANSSFSWWGAWLNRNENKIVISPKRWFNSSNNNTKDLLPNSWIKL